MALVKYGGGVVQMSGSIGGTTFARNSSGNYARARTKPVNPKSTPQSLMRLIMAYLVEHWNEQLTVAERGEWATYAAAISMKNRLGESIKNTGFNHFIRGNSLRLMMVEPLVEAGPAVLTLPPTDPTFAVTASVATQKISITLDETLDWAIAADNFMVLYQGRPQVHTRNFFAGPYRYTANIEGAVVPLVPPIDIDPVFPLLLGQKQWISARIVLADSRTTIRFQDDCLIGA